MFTTVGFAVSYSPSRRRHRGNMTASADGEQKQRTGRWDNTQHVQPMGSLPSCWAAVGPEGRRLGKRGSANPPARWNQPAIPIAMRQCDGRLGPACRKTHFPSQRAKCVFAQGSQTSINSKNRQMNNTQAFNSKGPSMTAAKAFMGNA